MQFSSRGQGAGVLKFSSSGPCLEVEIVQSDHFACLKNNSLESNYIEDAGAMDIAAALEKNTTLQTLE